MTYFKLLKGFSFNSLSLERPPRMYRFSRHGNQAPPVLVERMRDIVRFRALRDQLAECDARGNPTLGMPNSLPGKPPVRRAPTSRAPLSRKVFAKADKTDVPPPKPDQAALESDNTTRVVDVVESMDWDTLTRADLFIKAEERGIETKKGWNKQTLIKRLKDSEE